MTLYTATINRPGYLPDSDEPAPLFRTPNEAWRHLYEEHTAAWNYDNSDELHLETDTQSHVPSYHEAGALHAADAYVYSVREAVDLPSNRVELTCQNFSDSILFFTDMNEYDVHAIIADNVGTWWNIADDFPDTDATGVILLSDSWNALFNDDIILGSGIRSF